MSSQTPSVPHNLQLSRALLARVALQVAQQSRFLSNVQLSLGVWLSPHSARLVLGSQGLWFCSRLWALS